MSLKSWSLLFLVTLIIPLVGILTSSFVSKGFEKDYENVVIQAVKADRGVDLSNNASFLEKINLQVVCSVSKIDDAFIDSCNTYTQINYLELLSYLTFAFTLCSILLIAMLGKFTRKNRNLLFYLFRPGLFVSQIIAALLVISDSAILIGSIYFGESYYVGRIHVYLIGILGVMATYVALLVCYKALKPNKQPEMRMIGKIMPKENNSRLWEYIENIALALETSPPDTIIVGMDPNFFVTEAKVICLDGEFKGKSLYLSLPFCKTLTLDELTSIIGHELGHFIGEDTIWSRKFYPIYRSSIDTIHTLYFSSAGNNNGLVQLAFLPAMHYMNLFITSFETIEKSISRDRELNADKFGAKLTSPNTMAIALVKIHVLAYAWNITIENMSELLKDKKQLINIPEYFYSVWQALPVNLLKPEIGKTSLSHPTDTHPSLAMRLKSIQIELSEVYEDSYKISPDESAINLFENVIQLEENLTEIENYKLMKLKGLIG